jgi:exonuclease SbcC
VRESALEQARAADATLAERKSAAETLAATLAERRRGVPDELDGPQALAAALAVARKRAGELDAALAAARETAQTAAVALETARADAQNASAQVVVALEASRRAGERFATRLADQGLVDEAAWRAALREPAQLAALAAEVKTHDENVIAARATLEQAEHAASGLTKPDLDALQEAAAETRRRADEATAAKAGLDARLETLAAARRALDRIAGESADLEQQFAVAGRIAAVANGDNPRRLSFQRFVLGVHLDRVLEIATQRLRAMSSGRYDLERTGEAQGRARTAGLDLEVFDAWTGDSRPVSTLSGGESFMASLSLALGLAEAVQELSGGIRLDTIFVDEGFGSLDTETLDLALTTLTSLQENGRLVGIISHLAEVKERVDARLEVSSGKSGSAARFVVP